MHLRICEASIRQSFWSLGRKHRKLSLIDRCTALGNFNMAKVINWNETAAQHNIFKLTSSVALPCSHEQQ